MTPRAAGCSEGRPADPTWMRESTGRGPARPRAHVHVRKERALCFPAAIDDHNGLPMELGLDHNRRPTAGFFHSRTRAPTRRRRRPPHRRRDAAAIVWGNWRVAVTTEGLFAIKEETTFPRARGHPGQKADSNHGKCLFYRQR
ncbi:uncharacterized protein LOC144066214 [Stigmatopora argus]